MLDSHIISFKSGHYESHNTNTSHHRIEPYEIFMGEIVLYN